MSGPYHQKQKKFRWGMVLIAVLGLSFFGGGFIVWVGTGATHHHGRAIYAMLAIHSIEEAILGFETEYGSQPDVGSPITTDSGDGVRLLSILLGIGEIPPNFQNKRGIRLLSVRDGKSRKNGLIMNPENTTPEGLFDPWGNPYTVFLAGKDSNELHFTIAGKSMDLKGRRAAAVSPGADGKLGTSDDVRNW